MPTSYSPIDESSYSDSGSFDPEEMLNAHVSGDVNIAPQQPVASVAQERPSPSPNTGQPASAASAAPIDNSAGVGDGRSAHVSAMNHVTSSSSFMAILDKVHSLRLFKFLGIILFFFAAYAFVVSCSYFFTIGSDQSAVLNGEAALEMYENAGRKFGATLAHTLVYEWLGIGAFILIFYIGACGLSMIGIYRPGFWGMTMRCLLFTVTLSVILGLVNCEVATPVYLGGMHGQVLNQRLIAYSGIWGALAVSLILGSMVALLYLNELKRAASVASAGIEGYRRRQAERKARREARKAEAERVKAIEMERLAQERAEKERIEQERIAQERTEKERLAQERLEKLKAENEKADKVPVAAVASAKPAMTAGNEQVASDENTVDKNVSDIIVRSAEQEPAAKPAAVSADINEMPPLFSTPAVAVVDKKEEIVPDADYDSDDEICESSEEEEMSEPLAPLFHDSPAVAVVADRDPAAIDPRDRPLYDPRADLSRFEFPTLDLLNNVESRQSVDAEEMEENNARITKTLSDYGIAISNIKATVGPTVTLYEIIPAEGVRIAKIKNLEDDIALSLAALGIRIIAPIPGKGTIGIEVPNKDPQTVSMRSVFESDKFRNSTMELPMAIGRTVSNDVYMADLTKMPHLLVAGATGMGKSVGLNAIITSLLYKKHPSELKFVMVDPKKVEFSLYAKLERHYLAKLPDEEDAIITDPQKVVATLNSLCIEMENRYALLKDAQRRNVKEYNDRFVHHALNPERGHRYLPYIVVIVDEFADLIITAGKEVETPIARIAQMARAVGIHMILATQRPSTNVITGVIKANFPGRIAFRVFQMVDSRTIIDRPGANQLIGRGDLLFSNNGKIDRVQCAFIDTPEVTAVCDFIDRQVGYASAYELPEYTPESSDSGSVASLGDRDPLFDECARLVVSTDTASTSSLQRRYSIGYNRAGKIMDQMEAAGIVGPSQGGKPRQVLVDPMTLERILENKAS